MGNVEYKISGPGVLRAFELARSCKKPIKFVYDYKRNGEILRVGYTLNEPTSVAEITWFDECEIEVITATADEQRFDGKLSLEMDHPKAQERHFLLDIPAGDNLKIVLRILYRVHSDGSPDFVIQVEMRDLMANNPRNRPVIRYDFAHGFLHSDRIASDGTKSKEAVSPKSDSDAISSIISDLRENLVTWMAELGYGHLDPTPIAHASLDKDLDDAKEALTRLVEDPELIGQTKSTVVMYTDKVPGGLVNLLDELKAIRTKRDLAAFLKAMRWPGLQDVLEGIPDNAVISKVELPKVPGEPLTVTYTITESR